MKARDLMTPDAVVQLDTPVGEVAQRLLASDLGALVVINDDGSPAGLITAADVVAKHARPHVPLYLGILGYVVPIETRRREEELQRVLAVNAEQLMEEEFPAVSPEDDIQEVATLMVDHRLDAIPVVENGRVAGMVGYRSFLRLLIREETEESDASSGG